MQEEIHTPSLDRADRGDIVQEVEAGAAASAGDAGDAAESTDTELEACSICLESLVCEPLGGGVERAVVRAVTRVETRRCMAPMTLLCNHTFHSYCIVSWCEKEEKHDLVPTCPLCRHAIDLAQELKRAQKELQQGTQGQ